jgi:Chitobiase/beta-hexosaminidase C-terminal domain
MLGSAFSFFHKTFRGLTIVVFTLTVTTLGMTVPSYGQTVFNCSGFNSGAGTCGANGNNNPVGGNNFHILGGHGSITGSDQLQLAPANTGHTALSAVYTTYVNVQAFTATYTFIPSGNTLAFVLQNTNNQSGYQATSFVAGAGCEGGFFQAANVGIGGQSPNNVFAITMDGFNWIDPVNAGPGFNGFTYSNTNLYTSGYDPCHPNDGDPSYKSYASISTSPVPLNSPSDYPDSTTGDVYSVTITYDGSNVTEKLYNVTAGGTCTPVTSSTCFSHTWTNINIPSIVGGSDTALVALTASTIGNSSNFPNANVAPVLINSFSYTEGSTTTETAATPSFSPSAGTYSGSQNVALSSATSGAVICYNTTGNPATNGSTGCASGSRYTGPVTVSSNETMYAVAGAAGYDASPMVKSTYVIQPPAATPPIFSPAVGTYTSAQTVTISDPTSGATIYYTTNGTTPTTSSTKYAASITVSATETLKAIAVKSGDTNSAVASATYTIAPQSTTATTATPTFSVAGGTYTSTQKVTISDATPNSIIHYTTDGSKPYTSSPTYSGPITIKSNETLKAIAHAPGDNVSAVASAAYTIKK